MSATRKANQRARLKKVDAVIEAVKTSGVECAALVSIYRSLQSFPFLRHYQTKALQLPKEHEMPARDKYTVFSRKAVGYRKGIHKVPKFTRVSDYESICSCFDLLLLADITDESKGILIISYRSTTLIISNNILSCI